MEPGVAPCLARPTLRGGRVRDTKLTDFAGSYLVVFFHPGAWECGPDLQELAARAGQLRRAGCQAIACSTDSCMAMRAWVEATQEEGGPGGSIDLPLMEDRRGELADLLHMYDQELGACCRGVAVIDDKCVVRQVAASSLPLPALLQSSLAAVSGLREAGPLEVQGRKRSAGSFLERVWRSSLKPAASPRAALRRSLSREPGADLPPGMRTGRSRSKSVLPKVSQQCDDSSPEGRTERLVDSLVGAVGRGLGSRLAASLPLPDHGEGEVSLCRGRVRGQARVDRGPGAAKVAIPLAVTCPRTHPLLISFPIQVHGVSASYWLGGRRLEGELTFSYTALSFRVKLSQRVVPEAGSCLELESLQLEGVEGGRMEVRGFGPLNWLAGRKVSDLVQETVMQEVEKEVRSGLEQELQQVEVYFSAAEQEAPGLVPAGVLTHCTSLTGQEGARGL